MSNKLDRSKPYGTISGKTENNARYVQDGQEFDALENLIGAGKVGAAAPPKAQEPEPEPEVEPPKTSSIDDLKAGDIKQLVEDRGGVYKNKKQGIEFLNNVGSETADEQEQSEENGSADTEA